jgi:hypothetical protein
MLYTYISFQNRIQALSSTRAAAESLPDTVGSDIHYEHETRLLIGNEASTEGNKKKKKEKSQKTLSPKILSRKCL